MKEINKTTLFFGLIGLLNSFHCMAVTINHKGLGDAVVIPYYTVNNNLNTLVSVTNTTEQGKAIKVNIREGLHGYAALSYNIYLSAYDTWTFALVATESIIEGYEGQASAKHVSFDQSCAPFLPKAGQGFLPYDLTDGPDNLQRTREGFIEIIEMGDIPFGTDLYWAIDPGTTGVPANCHAIVDAWSESGQWHVTSGGDSSNGLLPGSGGLMAEAQIVDVAEGINYSIPVIALDGFHAEETIIHTNPGDTGLSLDAAAPVASIDSDGESYDLVFETGIDAVSAVLMSDNLMATYALDSAVAGKSELIYSLPTRRFYVYYDDLFPDAPFDVLVAGDRYLECPQMSSGYGGTPFTQTWIDRESQYLDPSHCGTVMCGAPPPTPIICGAVFVQSYNYSSAETPLITGSLNSMITAPTNVAHATENGFIINKFEETSPLVGTETKTGVTVALHGVPIVGVSLQRFTNAGAAEGLLAQYGGAQLAKSTVDIIEDEQ
jgi:hypothetical protein